MKERTESVTKSLLNGEKVEETGQMRNNKGRDTEGTSDRVADARSAVSLVKALIVAGCVVKASSMSVSGASL